MIGVIAYFLGLLGIITLQVAFYLSEQKRVKDLLLANPHLLRDNVTSYEVDQFFEKNNRYIKFTLASESPVGLLIILFGTGFWPLIPIIVPALLITGMIVNKMVVKQKKNKEEFISQVLIAKKIGPVPDNALSKSRLSGPTDEAISLVQR